MPPVWHPARPGYRQSVSAPHERPSGHSLPSPHSSPHAPLPEHSTQAPESPSGPQSLRVAQLRPREQENQAVQLTPDDGMQ